MRIVIASLIIAATAAVAAAQTPPSAPAVLDQVYACANISDEHDRLACYDGAVGRMRAAQSSGDFTAVDRHEAETISREAFGFSLPSLPHLFNRGAGGADVAVPEAIHLEVARISRGGDNHSSFTMTNGQVWMQTNTENPRNIRPGSAVTVGRAAIAGGFMLHVDAGGAAYRVRRVS